MEGLDCVGGFQTRCKYAGGIGLGLCFVFVFGTCCCSWKASVILKEFHQAALSAKSIPEKLRNLGISIESDIVDMWLIPFSRTDDLMTLTDSDIHVTLVSHQTSSSDVSKCCSEDMRRLNQSVEPSVNSGLCSDNTPKETKNSTMMAFAMWFLSVMKGTRLRSISFAFPLVGHSHGPIDRV